MKKGRQTVFFTAEVQNCSVQTKLENTPEHSVLDQFEGCLEEGIDVLSNKISLHNTLPAVCIERWS